MSKHSPSPWQGKTNGDIRDANGVMVAQVFDNPDPGTQPLGAQTSDFNQALIVAAPELLSALQGLLDAPDLNLQNLEPETMNAIKSAAMAISKATVV